MGDVARAHAGPPFSWLARKVNTASGWPRTVGGPSQADPLLEHRAEEARKRHTPACR
ncbi:hypothetical protein AKJ08_0453 [Vulgatibacter incomptus]|uniref:Uncharacterized protein n=1 Tax=Vulgatibacter incomptus TaxID=1391653 RepID=A0A0K1P9G3_9BACT|nr:hypothetical protein AKJ08_0453 [Vulgatibacter incomptus]